MNEHSAEAVFEYGSFLRETLLITGFTLLFVVALANWVIFVRERILRACIIQLFLARLLIAVSIISLVI